MRKIPEILKKHWTRVWLIGVLLLSAGIFAAHSAYTGLYSIKRVVSTQDSPGELFSSNCMRTDDFSRRRLTSAEYIVTICNFDQNRPTAYNPSDIEYMFHAELQVKVDDKYLNISELENDELKEKYTEKAKNYFVSKTEDDDNGAVSVPTEQYFTSENNFKVDFSADKLTSGKASIDKYKVKIDNSDLESANAEVFVHVWAEPQLSSLSGLKAWLYGTQTITDKASWTGEFLEQDCETVDYDFYNYIVSGSGEGKVVIFWDPEKFEINKFFFDSNSVPIEVIEIKEGDEYYSVHPHWYRITLTVDSTVKSRYEIQLYKKTDPDNLTGESYTGENSATKYIDCQYIED